MVSQDKDIYLRDSNKMGPSLSGVILDAQEAPYQNAEVIVTSGAVEDEDGPVEGATVSLWKGTVRYGTEVTTRSDGSFQILNVMPGTYNLKAVKGEQIVTALVVITEESWNAHLKLPAGKKNSVVEIEVPAIGETVVGGLNQILQDERLVSEHDTGYTQQDKDVVNKGGTVEIKLIVSAPTENSEMLQKLLNKVNQNSRKAGLMLSLKLIKTVKDENGNELTDQSCEMKESGGVLLQLLIPIPEELQGKESYSIFREHEGALDEITEVPGADGEYLTVNADKTQLTLYVKKFSEYVIAYSQTATGPSTPTPPTPPSNPTVQGQSGGETGSLQEDASEAISLSTTGNKAVGPGPLDPEPKTGDTLPLFPVAAGAVTLFMLKLMLWEYEFALGISEEKKKEMITALANWARGTTKTRAYIAVAGMAVVLVFYHLGKRISEKIRHGKAADRMS